MLNPTIGRFLSEDPAEDDLNQYRYVRNNPVNNADPSGLQKTRRGNIIYRDGSIRHNVEIDASLLDTLIANGSVLVFEPTDGRSAPINRRPTPLEPFLGNPQAKAEDERQRREAEAAKRGPARRVLSTPLSELRDKGVPELGIETLEEGGYEFVGRTVLELHSAIGLSGGVTATLQSLKDSEGRSLLGYWEYVDENGQRLYLVPVRMKTESGNVFAGYTVYESPEELRDAYALMQSLILTGALIAETSAIFAGEIGGGTPVPFRPRPSLKPGRIIGEAAEETIEKAAGSATKVGRGVWDESGPGLRGEAIEKQLGQNLPQTFPIVDKFKDGIATSIKSLDLGADTYQNTSNITRVGRGYIDKVAGFQGAVRGRVEITASQIRGRALDLAVPPGATPAQQQALKELVAYGQQKSATVNIIPIQ